MTPVDAATLLGIDVTEELRKVPSAGVAGDWALPLECARAALAHGAGSVELRLQRGRVELVAPGARLAAGAVRELQRVRDASLRPEDRHEALLRLEREAPTLLFLARSDAGALAVSEDAGALRLSLRVPGIEVSRAIRALQDGCRHAAALVRVNDSTLPRGFAAALAEGELAEPLCGRWAVVPEGDATRVDLLAHGILCARATLPEVPGLCVALEQPDVPDTALPAQRREHLNVHRSELIRQLLDALLGLEGHARVAKRRRALLLELAARRTRMRTLLKVPFLSVLGPNGESPATLLDALAAAEAGRREGRPLPVLAPELDPADFASSGEPVWRLDASGTALLGRIVGAPFEALTPLARPPRGLRALRERLRRLSERRAGWWRRPGAEIPASAWSVPERMLAQALRRAAAGELEIRLSFGTAAPRVEGRTLVLPRGHADVRAGVAAVARDPDLAGVVLLALAERLPRGPHAWPPRLQP